MLEGNYDYVFWVDADVIFKKIMTEDIVLKDDLPIFITEKQKLDNNKIYKLM